jgi:amino-acid N-acetyltransferase
MEPDIEIRPSEAADFEGSAALLEESRLTLEGFRESFGDALVAHRDGRIVGCVALEFHAGTALLRSLVVASSARGQRVGERLTGEALRVAATRGATDVYLLTETARDFFPRFGFRVEDRSLAPPAILGSVEFRTACPKSAVMMHRKEGA